MSKLVTAIITTHNRPQLCLKAVESVMNQTYRPIEIIVVDDNSTEINSKFLNKFLSENVKYVKLNKEQSKGGNYARNLGVQLSRGEILAFLDDDDEWLEEKIEKQIALLNKETKVVCCRRIFEYDGITLKKQPKSDLVEGDLSQIILYTMPYTTSSLLVEKSYFEQIGMFDENLRYWQDFELFMRLAQHTKIGVVKDCGLLYRVNTADKKRITNNLDGWEDAVRYIQNKHSSFISSSPQHIQKKRLSMISIDGAKRAGRIGNKKLQRKFLFKALINDFNVKNLIKFIFNISKVRG